MDNFPDSGIADANAADSNVADSSADMAAGDTGNDAMIDACMPSAETCNGVSDDCDDIADEGSCDFPNTSATCEPGGCVVSACDEGFLDCFEGMGCETASDRNNCGACGMVCGATEGCEAGVCVEHTLDWWWTVEGAEVLISNGNDQRYLLTETVNSEVVLRRSTGGNIAYAEQTSPYSVLVAMDELGSRLWEVYIDADALNVTAMSSIAGVDGVFIAGNFRGALRAGREQPDDLLESAGTNQDGFVLRVDSLGNVESVAQLTDPDGSDTDQSIGDIAVSPDGTVFAVGRSSGDLATRVGGDAVLSGTSLWFLHRVGGGVVSTPGAFWESVTTDSESVFVGMRLDNPVQLGGVEYADDRFQPLIAAYNHSLEFRWAQAPLDSPIGQGEDEPVRIHAANGSVFVSHIFDEMHSFGGHSVAEGGYLASLIGSDGSVAWARRLGTTPPAVGSARDHVYFAGSGVGEIDLGGGSLGPAVGQDALFGVLQSSGEYESARRFGGLDRDGASEVKPTSNGVLVSGTWSGVMNVDGVAFDALDDANTFIIHFSMEE